MDSDGLKDLTAGIRSKLFVPGSRPELFQKAMAGAADALSFDLEDSVTPGRKQEAREAVAGYLRDTPGPSKVIIVRVNALASEYAAADFAAVLVPGLHMVNVPKVEGREDVLAAVSAMEQAEHANGVTSPVSILANIETPKGLRLVHEIATAHPRVVALQIGFVDMSLACNIEADCAFALSAVRFATRVAAAEAGIACFDGAYPDAKNTEGFRVQAEEARALGLNGKSCIHPSQVGIANKVFAPSMDLVRHAANVVSAAEEAAANGAGAFLLDGQMIDAPIVQRARQVMARAKRYGIGSGE